MNQLLEFLNVLRTEEVDMLRNASFRGNEGRLLNALLAVRQQPVDQEAISHDHFGFTRGYYYKLISTVQRKCYQVLVPEGGTGLIRWLNRRSLNDHAFHELKLQEKDLSDQPGRETRLQFYTECLQIFQRNSRHRQHEKIPEYITARILSIRPEDDYLKLFCAIQLFISHIWVAAARGSVTEDRDILVAEYEALRDVIGCTPYPDLELEFRKAAGNYFIFIWDDNSAAVHELTRALDIAVSVRAPEADIYGIEAKMAELQYFTSSFDQAFQTYANLFSRFPDIAAQDLYHYSKYFQLCVILGRTQEVEARIDAIFGDHVKGVNPNTVVMGCLNYLKWHLSSGDTAAARPFLSLGRELLDKNSFFQYDTELRFLESYYFFLKKDYETCLSLIKRDLKFLRQKKRLPGNSELPWFPMLLQEIIDIRTGARKSMRPRFRPHFEQYQQSSYAVYGRLLRLALQPA